MPMKLLILGLLLERDMHPYEITLVMKERSMDQVIKLQTGSLYYAVDKLAAGDHIEAVEIIHSPDRPDKTIYRITDEGKELMEQLILQQIKKVIHPIIRCTWPWPSRVISTRARWRSCWRNASGRRSIR